MPLRKYTGEKPPISIKRYEDILAISDLKEAMENGTVTRKEIIAAMKMRGYTQKQIKEEFDRFCRPAGADAYSGNVGILGESDWLL